MDYERTNAPTGQERMRLEEMERILQHNFDQTGDHPAVTIQLAQTDCGKFAADGYRTFLSRVQSRDQGQTKRKPLLGKISTKEDAL